MKIAAEYGSAEAHKGVAEVDDEVGAEGADVGPLVLGRRVGGRGWRQDLEAA